MRWSLVLLCIAALLSGVQSLYEEQAGLYDWHQQNLGKVTHAEFALRNKPRIFLGTEAGVIGSVNLKDGSVAWRQTLADSDGLDALAILQKPAAVLSLTGNASFLRAWSAADGALLWEQLLAGRAASAAASKSTMLLLPDITGDQASDVAVLANGELKAYAGTSGKHVWSFQKKVEEHTSLLLAEKRDTVLLVSNQGRKRVAVSEVSTQDGNLGHSATRDSPEEVDDKFFAAGEWLFALSTNRQHLCACPLQGDAPFSCWSVSSLVPEVDKAEVLGTIPEGIILKTAEGVIFVAMQSGSPTIVAKFPGGLQASQVLQGSGEDLIAVLGYEDGLWSKVVSLRTKAVLFEQRGLKGAFAPLRLDGTFVGLDAVQLSAVRGKDPADVTYRLLLMLKDATLALLQRGEALWRREEALASTVSSLFVDLPAPSPQLEAEYRELTPSLAERFNLQLKSLKVQFNLATPDEKLELEAAQAARSDKLRPTRDQLGFRKLIIVLSSTGKLFALHNGDGRVLWSINYSPEALPQRAMLWRSAHDIQHAPEVLVLRTGSSGSFASVVNAHTGREVARLKVPDNVSQVMELPRQLRDGTADQRLLALVVGSGEGARLSPLPDTPAARAALRELAPSIYTWRADIATGVLEGYGVSPAQELAHLWTDRLAIGPHAAVLAVAARDASQPVNSHAKVLGDRSLKFKYLNPNTLFVAVGPPDGVLTSTLPREALQLTVTILDTVTGRPLFRQTHQGARGPVHAVFVENWVAYHYWSVANHRFEVSMLELYDASVHELSVGDVIFGEASNSSMRSSFEPVPLEVLRQSFFLPTGVNSMGVTTTQRGITLKNLLMATLTDQVYLLDQRFLDPRRPVGTPSRQDQEEGLMPYDENIPLVPVLFASYNKLVARVTGFVSAPTALESTSHVLAVGLDLFYTRVQPSRTFDSLPDDFPYALLALLTTALLIGALALRHMDDLSSLKKKWE